MELQMSLQNQTSVAMLLTMNLLLNEANNTNCVFSPISIHILLSLISSGAKAKTLTQLLSFLKSNSATSLAALASQIVGTVLADGGSSGGPKLLTGTRLWFEESLSLKPSFRQVLQTSYKADAVPADFIRKADATRIDANSWVSNQTTGLIKDILPAGSVTDLTRYIMANAMYFKGVWKSKFDVANTKEDDFHLLGGGVVRVPFMTSHKDQFVSAYPGFKVARMPYYQGNDKRQFSMYMFLPDARDGLPQLVRTVLSDPNLLSEQIREVPIGDFRIPRFVLSYGFQASKLLRRMGLTEPFSVEADLSDTFVSLMGENIFISEIFHKAFINVNEEGTEAAAASAAVAVALSAPFNPISFVADHPFLFIIREDMSGALLFTGQVLQPT